MFASAKDFKKKHAAHDKSHVTAAHGGGAEKIIFPAVMVFSIYKPDIFVTADESKSADCNVFSLLNSLN